MHVNCIQRIINCTCIPHSITIQMALLIFPTSNNVQAACHDVCMSCKSVHMY